MLLIRNSLKYIETGEIKITVKENKNKKQFND